MLYNTGETPLSQLAFTKVMASHDGSVTWSRPGMIESTYTPTLQQFPFETQHIKWVFGSWAYAAPLMKLYIHSAGLEVQDTERLSSQFRTRTRDAKINRNLYACCPDLYEDMEFSLELKRYPYYFVNQVVTPGIILAMVAWFSFFMDRKSAPARTTVVMTAMLAQVRHPITPSTKVAHN